MSCTPLNSQKDVNSNASLIPVEPLLANTQLSLSATKNIELQGLKNFIRLATLEFEITLIATKETDIVLEGCLGDGGSRLGSVTLDNTVLTFDLTTLTVDKT